MTTDSEVMTMEGAGAEERRKIRWVAPEFQRRYAFLLLSVVVLVSAVLIGTFWFHSEQVLNTLSNAGVLKQHSLYLVVEKQMKSLLWSVVAVSCLFSIFVFMMSVFLSHRIVGPLQAIKRSLEAMRVGRWGDARITLRNDDEFKDVAQMINEVVDQAQKRS